MPKTKTPRLKLVKLTPAQEKEIEKLRLRAAKVRTKRKEQELLTKISEIRFGLR